MWSTPTCSFSWESRCLSLWDGHSDVWKHSGSLSIIVSFLCCGQLVVIDKSHPFKYQRTETPHSSGFSKMTLNQLICPFFEPDFNFQMTASFQWNLRKLEDTSSDNTLCWCFVLKYSFEWDRHLGSLFGMWTVYILASLNIGSRYVTTTSCLLMPFKSFITQEWHLCPGFCYRNFVFFCRVFEEFLPAMHFQHPVSIISLLSFYFFLPVYICLYKQWVIAESKRLQPLL